MKKEKLSDAIGMIGDDLIEEAGNLRKKRVTSAKIKAVAACLAVLVVGAGVYAAVKFGGAMNKVADAEDLEMLDKSISKSAKEEMTVESDLSKYALNCTAVPETLTEPRFEDYLSESEYEKDWDEYREFTMNKTPGEVKPVCDFAAKLAGEVFKADGENQVVSPLNLYVALSMVSDSCAGRGHDQLVSLLGNVDVTSNTNAIYNYDYVDGESTKCLLNNSLWLDENLDYNADALDYIGTNYYAPAYRGKMGSSDFNKAFQSWLSKSTGGLLDGYISNESLSEDTKLAIVSALYFKSEWLEPFTASQSEKGKFNSPDGKEDCVYMKKNEIMNVWDCREYTAIRLGFYEGYNMWFFLPDEGVSPEKLASDPGVFSLSSNPGEDTGEYCLVHLKLPKFDVSAQSDMGSVISELGASDVFDSEKADFSPILKTNTFLSSISHAARVKIDEQGCEAAAYSVARCGASLPDKEIDLNFDRPFLFIISAADGAPLFEGVVNHTK